MAEQHEKALVPQIRFTGFTDPWEQRKLGEIAAFGGGHTPSMSDPDNYEGGNVLWVTSQDVKSYYLDGTTTQITEKGAKELTLYPMGALVMVTRSGILRHTLPVAELCKPSTVNQDIRVILPQEDKCCGKWLLQFFISRNKELLLEFGKTGTTVESVDFSKMKDMILRMPSLSEQRQIGLYFARLDNLITLHQRKYDKLCVLKKSMLDKMFPKGGSLYPEIRFAGFTDPWEQRKLGEVASGFEYGLNAAASDFDGEKKYLRITDIDDQTREFRTDDLSSPDINNPIDDRYLLKEGDILFARTGASVGKTYLYKASDGKTYYAGFLIRAHVSDEADAGFIFQSTLTERYKQFVLLTSQRSGQPGINAQEYSDLLLPLPSLMEQRRIGAFFDRLDSLITLHQRKLELLRNIKKSMLDKMFV
ncbi:restriction endonuclease subunit S [Bifidobacterium adolescentis]|nr:restriction endonuclease subunit S [Bifidobacterium adolescentis]KAB5835881.1 restriction endonuclease subunit S [Bifidobacterium adolescentis]KAB5839935.1 restriction endonuclease subunit S [Bifidobacterium adolescentis]KAB5884903.1 restriction endonuclease subunit S [Bifidobacterium adolescentis]KAB5894069.1 restriction endonuclease subunit S [Bifidobacterium adolescentis]